MEPLTTAGMLGRMVRNTCEARWAIERVVTDAEETPLPGWVAVEIIRIGLALTHMEAQLRLELESV